MSTTFGLYSAYYDLLYSDKDYAGETHYLRDLMNRTSIAPVRSLLEIGCGTGIHAALLAAGGLEVLGVDMSEEMLRQANSRLSAQKGPTGLSFAWGDARSFRCGRMFDAVVSVFHVLSYQTSDSDLQAMIRTASSHLNSGGIFAFDFWYGPGVLWQRPIVRVKHLRNEKITLTRVAEPTLDDRDNTVQVNYTVYVQECDSLQIQVIRETHRMRYLFLTEIDRLLRENAMERVQTEEWLSGKAVSVDSWGVCVVARKS